MPCNGTVTLAERNRGFLFVAVGAGGVSLLLLLLEGFEFGSHGFGQFQLMAFSGGLTLAIFAGWAWYIGSHFYSVLVSCLLFGILFAGILLRITDAVLLDTFDFDEYVYMGGVDQSIGSYLHRYVGSVNLPTLLHHWLVYRVLGPELVSYRVVPLLAGIVFFLLSLWGALWCWPRRPILVLWVGYILASNAFSIYFSTEAIFINGNSITISAIVFLFMLFLIENNLSRKSQLALGVLCAILAFFSRVFLVVPIVIGVILVIGFRCLRASSRDPAHLLGGGLWVFIVFPVMYAVQAFLYPFNNLGTEKRPDLAQYYWPTSDYSLSVSGAVVFLVNNTADLFKQLLTPIFPTNLPSDLLSILVLVSMVIVALQMIRHEDVDMPVVFALVFVVSTLAVMAVGGLAGVAPYGGPKYTSFLLLPLAILTGYGVDRSVTAIASLSSREINRFAFLVFCAFFLFAAGSSFQQHFAQLVHDAGANQAAIADLEKPDDAVILVDSNIVPALRYHAPDLAPTVVDIGWGTYFGQSELSQEIVSMYLAPSSPTAERHSIWVVLTYRDIERSFPQLKQILAKNFTPVVELEAPNLWAGLFEPNDSVQQMQ